MFKNKSLHIGIGILACCAAIILGLMTSRAHQLIGLIIDGDKENAQALYENIIVKNPIQRSQFLALAERQLRSLDSQYIDGKVTRKIAAEQISIYKSLNNHKLSESADLYLSSMTKYKQMLDHLEQKDYFAAADIFLQIPNNAPDYSKAVRSMRYSENGYVDALKNLIKPDGSYTQSEITQITNYLDSASLIISDKKKASVAISFSDSLVVYLDNLSTSSIEEWHLAIDTVSKTTPLMSEKAAQKAMDGFAEKFIAALPYFTPENDGAWVNLISMNSLAQTVFKSNSAVAEAGNSLINRFVLHLQQRTDELIQEYKHLEAETLVEEALGMLDDERISSLLINLKESEPATIYDLTSLAGTKFISAESGVEGNDGNTYSGDRTFYISQEYGAYKLVIPLNRQYTHMTGTILVAQVGGSDGKFGTAIYPDESCTDGTSLFSSGPLNAGSSPLKIDLDLRGRDQICVFFANNNMWFGTASVIYTDICFYDY